MAAKRQERLLERQRGAGTRQIKNTSFDLLFPGQEAAAPASLLPQKSGRSRKTPQPELLPQKSGRSRKTPQPELLPQRSTRRTPAPEEVPQKSSTGKTASTPNAKKRGRPKTIPEIDEGEATRNNGREAASKKRKLNTAPKPKKVAKEPIAVDDQPGAPEIQVKDSQPVEPEESVLPTAGTKKRKKRRSIGQQSTRRAKLHDQSLLKTIRQSQKRGPKPKPTPSQPIASVVNRTPEPPEYSRITTPAFREGEPSPVLVSVEAVEAGVANGRSHKDLGTEEVDVSGPKSRQRKRKPDREAAIQRVDSKVAEVPTSEAVEGDAPLAEQSHPETKAKRGPKTGIQKKKILDKLKSGELVQKPTGGEHNEGSRSGEKAGDVERITSEAPQNVAPIAKDTNTSNISKPKRKKRKSIRQQSGRVKRKATDAITPEKPMNIEHKRKNIATASPTIARAKPTRLPTPIQEDVNNPTPESSDPEVHEPEAIQPKKKRGRPRKNDAPSIRSPTERPAQPRPRGSKPNKATGARKPPKDTIPITFYAPPSPSASDSDAMNDPLSNPAPESATIKGINGVDVLSQTCLEMLAKTSSSLAEKARSSSDLKAEYKRRRITVDMYTEELEDRLYQLTTTLNTNTSLAAQVRNAAAEERALKKQIKALEADRETIKLKKEELLKVKKAKDLEALLSGIKGAVKMGMELEAKMGKG